ncbi:MAG TPA: rhamnogalacturonan acetylesterase [Steroidobacteraceae bacterium]|nr:rhamnogalacturonan acetylesterase [Steroidobacteraceae bacterium]
MTHMNERRRPIGHPIFRVSRVLALFAGFLLAGNAVAGDTVPQLFIAGDSTASFYKPNPRNQQGWGAVLQPFFDESKLRVVDVARGGRSSRTFITEGHWDRMLADVRAGDFVIIQFGHNDSGALNQEPAGSTKPLRARGTIPGIGNESEEIDNVITGKHETVYSFGWYLRKMIADTRAKGATPILFTLTKTNHWKDGRIPCAADSYRLWTWQTATNEKTAFVDLTRLVADRFQREGAEAVTAQFIDDTVHTNITGAEANARDAVAGLRAIKGLPLNAKLSKSGRAIRADRGPPEDSVCPDL